MSPQMLRRRWPALLGLTLGLLLSSAAPAAAEVTLWEGPEQQTLQGFGSVLTRLEFWDWFEAAGGERNAYVDAFETVRLGAVYRQPHIAVRLEGQFTQFENLPGDANAPAPRGALGTGPIYFQATGDRSATTFFIKHLLLDLTDVAASWLPGLDLRLGRFGYADGLETLTGEPGLDWLKRVRGSEKLVGPFGWSAFQRSFDGLQVRLDRPMLNWTTFVARPTQGGFEEQAGREMSHVGLAGTTLTLKPSAWWPHTAPRLFFLRYVDERNVSQRVDNVAATASKVEIALNTYGAEVAGSYPWGPGAVDALAWVAAQQGDWYELRHRAVAWTAEAGYQWTHAPWRPHLRAGWLYGSGDHDAGDGRHGTFFQVLPTARKYAQTPFYNLMNSSDLFAQVFAQPAKTVGLRADWHWVALADAHDRWYSGAGATQEHGRVFGFAGRASQGKRDLAQLLDVAVTYTPRPSWTLYGYYSHLFGGSVVEAIYSGASANFAYVEAETKF